MITPERIEEAAGQAEIGDFICGSRDPRRQLPRPIARSGLQGETSKQRWRQCRRTTTAMTPAIGAAAAAPENADRSSRLIPLRAPPATARQENRPKGAAPRCCSCSCFGEGRRPYECVRAGESDIKVAAAGKGIDVAPGAPLPSSSRTMTLSAAPRPSTTVTRAKPGPLGGRKDFTRGCAPARH